MMRHDLPALAIFAAIVEAGSFRAAARQLNVSVSTLSQSLRALEERLGLRLLHRSTRSLAPTEAGAHLLARLTPALAQIDQTLEALRDRNPAPVGLLRLNLPRSAGRLALAPMLREFLTAYPEIRLDLLADDRAIDIVAAGCDAGIRLHEAIQGDMIAHPIGPPLLCLAVGGSLAYLTCRGRPEQPADLTRHECLGQYFIDRQPFAWQFAQDEVRVQIQPNGRIISNDPALLIQAACDGIGLTMSFADDIRRAGLEIVLASWCQPFSGFQIYYPGRRHPPPALRALLRFSRNWYRAAARS